jgi:hypothetical protein
VERMLELNKRLKDAVGREREELERKIERTDGEIDELVHHLYGWYTRSDPVKVWLYWR